jgi:hypothetical protein
MYLDRCLAQDVEVLSDAKPILVSLVLTVSYRVESLCRPWVVPVDSAAVDDARELPASVSELVTDGGERKHNMQVLSADLHEVSVDLVSAVTA